MSAPPVAVRCPACGQGLKVVLAASPSTQWFPCPRCHRPVPVLVPRTPPPLYTWEVLHGLYPTFPLPRRPRFKPERVAAFGLLAITALALVLAGTLAVYGWEASAPKTFAISGTVETNGTGSPGVVVVELSGEGGYRATDTTDRFGQFAFTGVPSGAVTLTVNDPRYATSTVVTFVSSVYDAGSSGLVIPVVPAGGGNATEKLLTPFPDLETFLASLGSGAVLLALAGGLAAYAAFGVGRPGGAVVGALGGGGGIGVAAVGFFLSLGTPFPLLTLGTAAVGACGSFVLALQVVALSRGNPSGS